MARDIDKIVRDVATAHAAASELSLGRTSAFDRLRDQALGLDSKLMRSALGVDRTNAFEHAAAGLAGTSLSERRLIPSPVEEAIKRLQRPSIIDQNIADLSKLSPVQEVIAQLQKHDQWTAREVFRNYASMPDPVRDYAFKATEQFRTLFHRPGFAETIELARRTATSDALQRQVQRLVDQINGPWARTGSELTSMSHVAQLSALNRAATGLRPYSQSTTSLFRQELGDWRADLALEIDVLDPVRRRDLYIGRGYDLGLTDFPAEVVEELIEIVGDESEAPADIDGAEKRCDRAYAAMSRFERRVRDFIIARLQGEFGERWEAQIPQQMLEGWRQKHERDVDLGSTTRPRLIDYSDFTDYMGIIGRRDNWTRAFAPIFKRRTDVEESFNRLMPVRLVTMHSVLITADDEVLLTFETKRLLGAIARASN